MMETPTAEARDPTAGGEHCNPSSDSRLGIARRIKGDVVVLFESGEVPLAPCKAHACPAASFSFLEPFQCCVPLTAPSPACCLRPHRTSPWGEILGRASRPERPRGRTDHPDRAGPPDPCSTTRPRAWTALPPFILKSSSPFGHQVGELI